MEQDISNLQGYHRLEVYQRSRALAIRVHNMTLDLPKFEIHEEGSQIRRSSKSITNSIVEGYALRTDKNEYLQYLNRAYGSSEETIQHLDFLFSTKSLKDENLFKDLLAEYIQLSKMIFRFIQSVSGTHEKPFYLKELDTKYSLSSNPCAEGACTSDAQSTNTRPLFGLSVLVTRSKEANAEMRTILESRGAEVLCLPTIEITDPDSWNACDDVIWKLAEYETVCFTSKNAVTKFLQRLRILRPEAVNTLSTRNLYAVGAKTQATLESTGFSVTDTPKNSSAEALVNLLRTKKIAGTNILFPKGNIAREVLPQHLRAFGAKVEEVVVYKTVIPEPENLEHVRALLSEHKIDIITFFSPSSVQNFIELIGVEPLQHALISVIGPTTADAVKESGLATIIVPQVSTTEGMIDAIEEYIKSKN